MLVMCHPGNQEMKRKLVLALTVCPELYPTETILKETGKQIVHCPGECYLSPSCKLVVSCALSPLLP